MAKVVSLEGCVGAGKTSLTNYFSFDLKCDKILESYEVNPFLKDFYAGQDVTFETEMTFLMIHYTQLKKALAKCDSDFILADFSIEKDLAYARMNLRGVELKLFEDAYAHVISKVGVPHAVIYIDLSINIIKRRIFQRGRPYEITSDPAYFKKYNDLVKEYFENNSRSSVFFFNVDDLILEAGSEKLTKIQEKITEIINSDAIDK